MPRRCSSGISRSTARASDYERFVYGALADDLREAEVPDGASPVKSAAEVFRIFRDPMRSVVEQGGLSLDSYLDFNADICSRIHRLVAGPPALRSRQFLALMDAGVLRDPVRPCARAGPDVHGADDPQLARTRISSTAFDAAATSRTWTWSSAATSRIRGSTVLLRSCSPGSTTEAASASSATGRSRSAAST